MSVFAVCVILSNVFGLVSYSLDVYSDLALGVHWLKLGHRNWGAATLAFFFIPGAINSILGRFLCGDEATLQEGVFRRSIRLHVDARACRILGTAIDSCPAS